MFRKFIRGLSREKRLFKNAWTYGGAVDRAVLVFALVSLTSLALALVSLVLFVCSAVHHVSSVS